MRLTIPIRLRWSDIDGYAHVNNAAMLSLLEDARIQAFWRTAPDGGTEGPAVLDGFGSQTLTLVAHQQVQYLLPIPFGQEPLRCELWLGRLGGSSLDVSYEVFLPGEERVLATRAATTVVLVDAATQRPRRITDAERVAWTPYIEAPVTFTRR